MGACVSLNILLVCISSCIKCILIIGRHLYPIVTVRLQITMNAVTVDENGEKR